LCADITTTLLWWTFLGYLASCSRQGEIPAPENATVSQGARSPISSARAQRRSLAVTGLAAAACLVLICGNILDLAGNAWYWKARDYEELGKALLARRAAGARAVDAWKKALDYYGEAVWASCPYHRCGILVSRGKMLEGLHALTSDDGLRREALASYDYAIALQPENPYPRADRARLLASTAPAGKMGEALQAWKTAIERDPYNPVFHADFALAYLKAGDLTRAKGEMRRSIEIFPFSTSVRLNLAKLLLRKGLKAEARDQLLEVLKMEPENRQAKEFLEGTGNSP
jgi:tetratricopeptide (TPR) repeat protein